jgi:hypothetical protein
LFNKAQTTLICFPGGKTGSYTIPNSVTAIEDFAFAVCIGLTSISIPSSVTTIGDGVFGDCIGLTSIFVDANNTAYSSNAGVLFNKVQTTLICFSGGKTGSYTIPNTVTAIEDLAFSGCIGLTSVTIPNSVTSIGEEAFSGCIGLTSVTISNSVTDIGDYTFSGCIGLTEIYVKAVTPPSISSTTFYDVSTTIAIHVPCGKKTAYQSAAYWSDFTNIIEDILFTVTVQSNDATMGNVNITQHNTCTNNTEIIAATPNNGYRFVQWNDGNTQNPRTITVRQDTSFTAIFAIEGMFYVGVMSNNTTMGTVSGSGDYAENTTVTISATPNSGYRFVQWNDGNTQNPRTITVRQDTSFIAIFVEDIPVYHVTVTTNDSEKGTVSGEGDYSLNTSIIIKATPKAGYRFVHWNDGNTVASRTITVTQDTNFMAIFAISDPNKYHVTVLANKENMGTVAGDGDYERNTTISIVAFPNQGYRFAHWNDGNVENPRTVTVVMRDLLFIAIFEAGVSITDIEEAPAINVYPNPARDNIHITLPENVSQAVFALYDIQGKVLIRKEIVSQETLSVSNLAGGIYIYHVITDKKTHTGKLKIKN